MPLYEIKDWDELYENANTRKLKNLTRIFVPNKHDGNGYRRIMALPDGAAIFGVWILLLQVASKMPRRGVLGDSDGPLSSEDIAFKTGCRIEFIERALQVLVSPAIAWLTATDLAPSPIQEPLFSQLLPASPNVSQNPGGNWEEMGLKQNRTEQNRRGGEGTAPPVAQTPPPRPAPPPLPPDPALPRRAPVVQLPAPPPPDTGPDRAELAAQAVDAMLPAHWVPSNRSQAIAAMERVLCDAVQPDSVAARIVETHQQHSSYRRKHPECRRRPQLAYWLSDGDYLSPPPAEIEQQPTGTGW